MRQNRPVVAIAKLVGLEPNYARKAIKRLADELGIEYHPTAEPPGGLLTDASRVFRNNLGNMVYDYRNHSRKHEVEIAIELGLTQAQQTQAVERGGRHDFSISELERLARVRGESFPKMTMVALLKGIPLAQRNAILQEVIDCLNS
jgi:hypothetical protein